MRRRSWLRWVAGLTASPGLAALPAAGATPEQPPPRAAAAQDGAAERLAAAPGNAGSGALDPAVAADPDDIGITHRPLHFPRDHGAHSGTRTEWWYLTGWLVRADAPVDAPPAFGFQVTFFRSRTGLGDGLRSRFAPRQLIFAHAAVTDLAARRLRHDERIAREGFGIAEASTSDAGLRLRDWRLQRTAGAQGSVYLAQVASDSAGFALDLRLAATQPLLLQGKAGYSRKGPREDEASRYVSEPQLQVSGAVRSGNASLIVRGRGWMDHEWSDTLMPADAVGWDWIGFNLDDGGALMAFRLRRRDGSSAWSACTLRRPGAEPQTFEGLDAARFTPLADAAHGAWTSPATGARYPVHWRIDTPFGGFEVRTLLDAQELDSRAGTGSVYWEGLSELLDGANGRHLGWGYLEMTGYAGVLRL